MHRVVAALHSTNFLERGVVVKTSILQIGIASECPADFYAVLISRYELVRRVLAITDDVKCHLFDCLLVDRISATLHVSARSAAFSIYRSESTK